VLTGPGVRSKAGTATRAFRSGGVGRLASVLRQKLIDLRRDSTRALRSTARRAMEFGVRPHLLRGRVSHLYGPAHIDYAPDELLVITVVRNGALYVRSFLEHYRALGVRHCVFLDNCSTDDTVDRLCAHAGVTVLQTDAPYEKFENTMKRYLAERFSAHRWNLCADIDELFDYPLACELPLEGFLQYLNERRFTAVVAQMLDMFSELPLGEHESSPDDRLMDTYGYYDISAIDRHPYEWADPPRPAVAMHWGGIRRTVFGTNNGLTKAALVLMDGKVKPFVGWHQVTGAAVADVTGVLMHYPFVSSFRQKVEDAVRTGRYGAITTNEYVSYGKELARNPRLCLKGPSARLFTGLEPLIADGFLVVSDDYLRWVATTRGTLRHEGA
jgi:Glycosyl transferase family 2